MFNFGHESNKFYLEVSFSHPIHDRNFFKASKRMCSSRKELTFNFEENEGESFFPNVVILPLTDFNLKLSVVEFNRRDNRVKYSKYVSLRGVKVAGKINVQCE